MNPKFSIYTGAMQVLTKELDGVERKYIRATASSSVRDLHGDEIVAEAIQKMATSAKGSDMTIFLNHSYGVPEDVFGTTTDARAVAKGLDSNGQPIWDLEIEASLNESNPRAVQTYAALESGVKLGVSIGAMIEGWEPIDKKAGPFGGMRLMDLSLLEASVVGIPANPRSWVERGVQAVKGALANADRDKLIESMSAAAGLTTASNMITSGLVLTNGTTAGDGTTSSVGPEIIITEKSAESPESSTDEPPAVEDVEIAADSSTETDAPPTVEDEAEPDVTLAAEEPTALPTAPSESPVSAQGLLASGVDMIVNTYKAQLQAKDEEINSLITERDEAVKFAQACQELVAKLATLPLGKKTSFKYTITAHQQALSGLYSEEFLKFLERTPNQ